MALHTADVKTLGHAWREFLRRPSPRWIAAGVGLFAVARLAVGDLDWRDAVLAAGLVAVYPFGEWAIHVYLLHLPPFRWRGRPVELITAKEHRWHHERPHNLDTVLLGPKEVIGLFAGAIPLVAALLGAILALAAPGGFPAAAILTATVAGGALVFVYEWTHFLIHTSYRPRTRAYRLVWQTHRLHHFKNEHYWHGITSTIADHAFGTRPDHREVERSPTARTLQPGG